ADDKLQQVYKALLKQIPQQDEDGIPYTATKKQLRVAQKAWQEFVKQDCKTISVYNKGSALRDVERYSCLRLHTQQRTSDLERFLSRRDKPKS
ncbi:MAG TPA: lysozyme inhibitor LprI family protein, partial [Oxalicibacterium sp.]|nr:lysozyme inhibitor LprI family protein [Oxalicibacterium sp.]